MTSGTSTKSYALAALAGVAVIVGATWIYPRFMESRAVYRRPDLCASNLKQIGMAVSMYADDYDESMPPKDWMAFLKPYVSGDVFHCPTVQDETHSVANYGYALNKKFEYAKFSPSTEPLAFDSNDLGKSAWSDLSTLPVPPRHWSSYDRIIDADMHLVQKP